MDGKSVGAEQNWGAGRMEKISQLFTDDCVVCAVAMVMGPPYTYEKVLQDRLKYRQIDDQSRFLPWWKDYLKDEGFETEHRPLNDPKSFSHFMSLPERSRALLVFRIPHLKIGHIVAIDRFGVIDPQDRPTEYQALDDFRAIFKIEGWQLYSRNFWLVRKNDNF